MNVHISYKLQKTPDIDREIQHWIGKLQKRLQVFRPELIHLKGLVEHNTAREGTTVSLNLRLPSGQMAAQESASPPVAAVKAAFDDLLAQLVRHKQLLRHSHRRRGRRPAEIQAEVPFEETIAAVQPLAATSDDIRSYVNANFARIGRFVQHELFMRESAAELDPGSLSTDEVVDEVAARALDDEVSKPDLITLEPWFYRLALQSIDDLAARLTQGDSDVNLQDRRRRRDERASDEARFQFHQPDEAMSTESSIADRRTPTPEEIAYTDEMITLVQFALKGAASDDREAFILHALEGFSVAEIAAITDRKREEIVHAINRAREKLRSAFPADNPFKRKMLQHSGAF